MKKSTLYKLLGYAALLVVLYFAAGMMKSSSSIDRLLIYLGGGSLMYWGVMVWLYGNKHKKDPPQESPVQGQKHLTGPRRPHTGSDDRR